MQAISLLPRTQGRAVMESLVLKEDGKVDKRAAKEVGGWLRDAGAVMRAHAMGLPSPDVDDAVVEFFEDVGDAISDAVNAVVDALIRPFGSLCKKSCSLSRIKNKKLLFPVRHAGSAGAVIPQSISTTVAMAGPPPTQRDATP